MKQTRLWLTTIAVLLCSLAANAHDFEVGGIYYNITSESDKQAEVTFKGDSYNSYDDEYSGSITIPATVTHNGVAYSVTSIGSEAFYGCSGLTAITIPEGVTSIGSEAFSGCSKLSSITLPEGVTSIGREAFYWCSTLTDITLPEGVTSIGDAAFRCCFDLTAITLPESATSTGNYAFQECRSLTDITLPEGVTSIGDAAFRYCTRLTDITLPKSVTSIGEHAFDGCEKLTAITIPENSQLTSIGYYAFYGCHSLTAITIPEGVTSIGYQTFYGCSKLSSITLPEGVTSIGSYAFTSCGSLTAITIPESVTSIGYQTFYGCRRLTAITIPESVTSIGGSAFSRCSSLTAITIPESVTSIGSEAFSGCSSLTAIIVEEGNKVYDSRNGCNAIIETNSNTLIQGCSTTIIPEGVTSIGNDAFYGCSGLTAITIPEGVTSIGNEVFRGCSSLTAINIPESVTSIGSSAFYGCSSLTAISLPESVTSIGKYAFYNCSGLTTITCEAITPPAVGDSKTFYNVNKSIPVYVPAGSVEAYKVAGGWSEFTNIVGVVVPVTHITLSESSATLLVDESLTLTATVAPDKATDKTLTWSSSNPSVATVDNMGKVTAVAPGTATITATANDGSGVSAQCEVTVTTPAKVEIDGIWYNLITKGKVADVTFKGDDPYQGGWYSGSITLPATVTYGGVVYNVTSIGEHAFRGCSSLTAINIPEGVTSIGDGAFSDCSKLSSITLPEGVTSIRERAFSYCSSLTAITIPEGVTSIGELAFYGCSSLTDITLPEGVTSIGSYAFNGCRSLTAITLPEGVTSIGSGTFNGCSGLTAITIPEGVTSIGDSAFRICSSLTAITCEATTPPTVYSQTFYNVNKSIPVYVPAGSVEAYKSAEGWSEFTNIVGMSVPITHITLSQSSATLLVEESLTLTATIAPDNATDKTLTWSSSNPSVATVDDMGKVTAIAPGTATIAATANDGSGVSAQCEVTVPLSTNKNYRIKNVSTGLYLQVSGNNTNMTLQSKAEGVEPTQVFQLEDAGEGMYYIKAADGDNNYYAHASTWNFNATSDAANKTPFTIALIDSETEVYTIHQSTSSYTGLAGSDASGVGSAIYCNKGVDNNGKWCFETLTEEENSAYFVALTAAARALLDAAIARAEEVVTNRSEVLTAEEVAAINSAVQEAKDSKDDAVEEAELNALTNAVSEAVDAAVYVWSLDELNSNTSYAVATEDRGAWYAQSERLNSTVKVEVEQDIADTKQQFAFVKSPTTNACYLYSVGEEKFVKVEGGYTILTETPVHTISFLEGTRSTAFPWVVAFNADGVQKQLGVSNGYDYGVITNWNNLNDKGNTVRIEKVAAFDASAALALIDALETSIEKTGIASQNSEIIFDLQGRRVEKPNKPGIYIVGGRKVVIK